MTSIALNKVAKPTKKPVYDYEETVSGVWKTHHYSNGQRYREFQSYADWFGLPLISITSGVDPELGRRKTAHGAIAEHDSVECNHTVAQAKLTNLPLGN